MLLWIFLDPSAVLLSIRAGARPLVRKGNAGNFLWYSCHCTKPSQPDDRVQSKTREKDERGPQLPKQCLPTGGIIGMSHCRYAFCAPTLVLVSDRHFLVATC